MCAIQPKNPPSVTLDTQDGLVSLQGVLLTVSQKQRKLFAFILAHADVSIRPS